VISLEDVDIKLKGFALTGMNLKIRDGEYYILLGPSGVGKTIVLETIAGIHRPHRGRILIDGNDVTSAPPEYRRIAFVPQDLALFPHLNVLDNILFGVRMHKQPTPRYQPLLEELIETLQLQHRLTAFPRTLSGGEKQRAALARALITQPRIMLLDEPMSALDPPIRRQLHKVLSDIHTLFGITILHVTHNQEEAFILSDIISVMMDGKILQTGKRNRVYFFPENRRIALFTGMENVFSGEVVHVDEQAKEVQLMHQGILFKAYYDRPVPRSPVFFGFRAEEVMLIKENRPLPEAIREENLLSAVLRSVVEKGSSHTMVFEEKSSRMPITAEVPNYVYRKLNVALGKEAALFVRKRNICLMEE